MPIETSLREGKPLPRLDEVGFRAFSQFDEDGILLYLFTVLGVAHKTSVEICAGVGYECNSANLIINHAWDGLLIDGDAENVRIVREFYGRYPDTFWRPPTVVHAWVDAETINDVITDNGFSGEIDLFSLDMDGVDFWIWKAITCINPRVVVLEFNGCIPADVSVTIPYDRNFAVREHEEQKPGYLNASLAAWVKLGREKGYRLVGRNRNMVNAFFVGTTWDRTWYPRSRWRAVSTTVSPAYMPRRAGRPCPPGIGCRSEPRRAGDVSTSAVRGHRGRNPRPPR